MDDMEEVTQRFAAEMNDYIDEVHRGASEARRYADANEEAKAAVDGLRDHAIEAGEALGHVRDEALEAAAADKELASSARDASAQLDLMGLSGASTFTSLGPLLGVMGALAVAGAAVAPAFAAAGLGIGAFGAFAIPTLQQVFSGMQQVSKQQAILNSATSTAKQRAAALQHEKAIWASMPAPIADVIRTIQGLKSAWQDTAKAFQPEVLSALDEALGIARDLMREIVPLAVQGGYAINGALMMIKAGIDSSGFRQFLAAMTRMVVPATQAIMHLAGTVLGVLGHALTALAPLSVPFIHFVTVLISALGGPAIAALHVAISLFLGLARAIEPLLPGLSKIATLLIGDIGSSFQAFIPIITRVVAILGGALLKILTDLEPVIANFLTPNTPFMLALDQLPGLLEAILPLFTGLAAVLANPFFAQLAVWILSLIVAFKGLMGVLSLARTGFMLLTAVMEVNPLILIATAIAALVVAIVLLTGHCKAFRDFWKDAWKDVEHAALAAWHFLDNDVIHPIEDGIRLLVSWVEHHWKLLATILATVLLGPVGGLVVWLATHWSMIVRDVSHMVSVVTGWFRRLPGMILHALGHLGSLLWGAGKDIINGLWNGLKAAAGPVLQWIGGVGHDISSTFGKVLSIFSPSRVFYMHGVHTLLGYLNGLKATAPALLAYIRGIGGQIAGGGLPGITSAASGGAGGTSVHVSIPVTLTAGTAAYNSPAFLQYLQQVVQEAILRYNLNNPGNGLALSGRL